MNITELKAAAFDALRQVEIWQKRVQELSQAIAQAEAEQVKADNIEMTKKAFVKK